MLKFVVRGKGRPVGRHGNDRSSGVMLDEALHGPFGPMAEPAVTVGADHDARRVRGPRVPSRTTVIVIARYRGGSAVSVRRTMWGSAVDVTMRRVRLLEWRPGTCCTTGLVRLQECALTSSHGIAAELQPGVVE